MKSRCNSRASGVFRGQKAQRNVLAGVVFGLLCLGAPRSTAGASPAAAPAPDSPPPNMAKLGRESIQRSLADAITRATTPRATLDMVRRLSEERRTAHRVIGAESPLTDFRGIVLTDTYDEDYIAAIDSVCSVYLRTDESLPGAESGAYLSEKLADLPPISDTPAAFVAAFVVMRCVQATMNIPGTTPAEVRADIPEVAIRLIHGVTERYMGSRRSFEERQRSDEIWHASVLERVRCPTHATPYSLKEERNGLRADGSFYRRYVVHCQGGSEARNLDFDLEALSAISKSGGRQQLPRRLDKPARRQPGVEP